MIYANRAGVLVSDFSLDELHSFSSSIGLDKSSFVDHPTHPHYTLTRYSTAKREMVPDPVLLRDAFDKGAKFVSWRRLSQASQEWRSNHVPIGLERAVPIYRQSGFLGVM